MKLSLCILLTVILTYGCFGNGNTTRDSSSTRKIHYQIGVGVALTNFSYPSPGYSNRSINFFHSDVFIVKTISQRSDIRVGIAYEPVGYKTNVDLNNGQSYFIKNRLFYSNLHVVFGYKLSRLTKRFETKLLTGVFSGRLLQDDILSLLKPDNQLFRSRSVGTYKTWNRGVSVGFSSSIAIKKDNSLGLRFMYLPGLSNIFLQKASDKTGIKRFTRSVDLSTFITF